MSDVESLPVLVIPAGAATDLVRTVPCPGDGRGPCLRRLGTGSRYGIKHTLCNGSGRVPDPAAPRRLTFPERPVVPCRKWGYHLDHFESCKGEGVVPLVGGMTVALAVEQCFDFYWRTCDPTDETLGPVEEHNHRQVVVAVAQVADVIEECKGPKWGVWAPCSEADCTYERRWVVVLSEVDPCEPKEVSP